ncbi:hypothetical protein J6590_108840 [Homalodisca vitripennis]|nr:hypothetical protein J6590_108840 [Homalodisca vitripennis]
MKNNYNYRRGREQIRARDKNNGRTSCMNVKRAGRTQAAITLPVVKVFVVKGTYPNVLLNTECGVNLISESIYDSLVKKGLASMLEHTDIKCLSANNNEISILVKCVFKNKDSMFFLKGAYSKLKFKYEMGNLRTINISPPHRSVCFIFRKIILSKRTEDGSKTTKLAI